MLKEVLVLVLLIVNWISGQEVITGIHYRPHHYVRSDDSRFVRFIIKNLIRFPKDIFEDFPEVRHIDVSDCGVEILKLSDFVDGKHLLVLNLRQNKLRSLGSETFVFLSSLEKLFLDENEIEELDSEVFRGLKELKGLYLQNNKISTIMNDAFRHLGELIELDLSNNDIHAIQSDLFTYNYKLEELNLRNCKIRRVSLDAFLHLPCLKKLDLSYNAVRMLHLPSVDQLEIDNCNLNELYVNGSVRILSARNNILEVVEIQNITTAEVFNLENNLLHSIDFLAPAKKLKKLNLSMNRFNPDNIDPEIFSNMTSLKRLDLSHLQITDLHPEVFADLAFLEKLNLSGNEITELDVDILRPLVRLRELDLRGNNITNLSLNRLRNNGFHGRVYGLK